MDDVPMLRGTSPFNNEAADVHEPTLTNAPGNEEAHDEEERPTEQHDVTPGAPSTTDELPEGGHGGGHEAMAKVGRCTQKRC